MKKRMIDSATLEISYAFITRNCRPLEQRRFAYLFGDGAADNVLAALQPYQNEDGGFGHGLEPDFWLPDSSPMATTIAFQIFDEVGVAHTHEMVDGGLRYFDDQYQPDRKGWFAVPPAVNDSPHAPWWQYDPDRPGTVIDLHWGNPSAEIISYLYKYAEGTTRLPLDELLHHAVEHLNGLTEFQSPNEIFCYLRLFEILPEERRAPIAGQLSVAIRDLVSLDPAAWTTYVPRPTDFVASPASTFYPLLEDGVELALDYLVETLNEDGVWTPHWSWGQYEEAWNTASKYWAGVLAIHNLMILQNFGRLEQYS